MRKRTQTAFTLIELLVVVGIIAMLVAILLPALHRARERANRIADASNMRQTYLALIMYAQTYKELPAINTWEQEVINGPNSPTGESMANGAIVLPTLLVNLKFITAKAAQCTSYNNPRSPWTYDWFRSEPWFRYNGPSTNGWWEVNYGHGAMFSYYGWLWWTSNVASTSSHGVRYRNLNDRGPGPSSSSGWYTHRAILCCPRMIQQDPFWTVNLAYEPHGNPSPQSASAGIQVQDDTSGARVRDRDYCFTDGHVEYIHAR